MFLLVSLTGNDRASLTCLSQHNYCFGYEYNMNSVRSIFSKVCIKIWLFWKIFCLFCFNFVWKFAKFFNVLNVKNFVKIYLRCPNIFDICWCDAATNTCQTCSKSLSEWLTNEQTTTQKNFAKNKWVEVFTKKKVSEWQADRWFFYIKICKICAKMSSWQKVFYRKNFVKLTGWQMFFSHKNM